MKVLVTDGAGLTGGDACGALIHGDQGQNPWLEFFKGHQVLRRKEAL